MNRRHFFKAAAVTAIAPLAVVKAAPVQVPIVTSIGLVNMLKPWYKRPAYFYSDACRFEFADNRETLEIRLFLKAGYIHRRSVAMPRSLFPGEGQASVHEVILVPTSTTYLLESNWEVIIENRPDP